MPWTINYIFVLIGTFLIAIVGTPLVRSLAFRVGAVDNPNARRINKKPMPSAGGLAIFLGFCTGDLGIYAYDYSEGCLAYFLF